MAGARQGKLTKAQRTQLARAFRAWPDYIRADYAGARPTLASLHGAGLLERRAWRTTGSPAYEYRLARAVVDDAITRDDSAGRLIRLNLERAAYDLPTRQDALGDLLARYNRPLP